MKWGEMSRVLRKKLGAVETKGKKHDFLWVKCGDRLVGGVKMSRGGVEMKNREIGGSAQSLRINEYQFRALIGCSLEGNEFCAIVFPPEPVAGAD